MISAKEARKKTISAGPDPKIINKYLKDIEDAIYKAIAKGETHVAKSFHINEKKLSSLILRQIVKELENYGYEVLSFDLFWLESYDVTLHIYW